MDSADPKHEPNLIANITLIDGYSNKHRIGKKAPSKYTKAFAKDNKELSATLKSHFIGDLESYGVSTDEYAAFIDRRALAISLALNVKLRSMTPAKAAELEAAQDIT